MSATGKPSVILLDIEGTTTPISFVYDTLFPYARAHLEDFLRSHSNDEKVRRDLQALAVERRAEASSDAPPMRETAETATACRYLFWLMDQDRKSPALKSIQGKTWQEGYTNGQLKGDVFADVPVAFARWHDEGHRIAIYSSGSVLAQKLLFRYSSAGDLTQWIAAHFDTAIGAKTERSSYSKIAKTLGIGPDEILFLSDVPAELDAARSAGFDVCLIKRPGNRGVAPEVQHPWVSTFDEL